MSKRKTHYYYVDDCVSDENDEISIFEFSCEKEFIESITWNRKVAKEYGDKVDSRKAILEYFNNCKDGEVYLNGAFFVKQTYKPLEHSGILKTAKGVLKYFDDALNRWVIIKEGE